MLAGTSALCLTSEAQKEIFLGWLRFSLLSVNSACRVKPTRSAPPSPHNMSHSPPRSPEEAGASLSEASRCNQSA